jgi:hypothetical protein
MYGALHFADLLEQIYRCKSYVWGGGGERGARGASGKIPRGGREGESDNVEGGTGRQTDRQTERERERERWDEG